MSITKMWRRGDPRYTINKRDNIIILRPQVHGWIAGTAFVATKDGWYIHTSFDDHKSIDKWDPDWAWCFAPKIDFNEEEEERFQKMVQDICKECGYFHPGGTCMDS